MPTPDNVVATQCRSTRIAPKVNHRPAKISLALKAFLGETLSNDPAVPLTGDYINIPEAWDSTKCQ